MNIIRRRSRVRRQAMLLCLVAAALAVGGFLLLGLPGALMLEVATPLAGLLSATLIHGDQLWPAAIMLAIVGPFALPLAYLAATRLASGPRGRAGVTAGLALIANVILATVVMASGGL